MNYLIFWDTFTQQTDNVAMHISLPLKGFKETSLVCTSEGTLFNQLMTVLNYKKDHNSITTVFEVFQMSQIHYYMYIQIYYKFYIQLVLRVFCKGNSSCVHNRPSVCVQTHCSIFSFKLSLLLNPNHPMTGDDTGPSVCAGFPGWLVMGLVTSQSEEQKAGSPGFH